MNSCELYLIQENIDGPIKIGRSVSTEGRLRTLQTGNPRGLRVVQIYTLGMADAIDAEKKIHEQLSDRRLCGEWFNISEQFITGYLPDFFLSEGFPFYEGEAA